MGISWLYRSIKEDQYNTNIKPMVTMVIISTTLLDYESADVTMHPHTLRELSRVGSFNINNSGVSLTTIINFNV